MLHLLNLPQGYAGNRSFVVKKNESVIALSEWLPFKLWIEGRLIPPRHRQSLCDTGFAHVNAGDGSPNVCRTFQIWDAVLWRESLSSAGIGSLWGSPNLRLVSHYNSCPAKITMIRFNPFWASGQITRIGR